MQVASAATALLRDFQIASFADNQAQQLVLIVPRLTSEAGSLRSVGQATPGASTALSPGLSVLRFHPPQPLRHSPPPALEPAQLPPLPCGAFPLRAPWRICATLRLSLC